MKHHDQNRRWSTEARGRGSEGQKRLMEGSWEVLSIIGEGKWILTSSGTIWREARGSLKGDKSPYR